MGFLDRILDRLTDTRALALWEETNASLQRLTAAVEALAPPVETVLTLEPTVAFVDDATDREPEPDESAGLEEPPEAEDSEPPEGADSDRDRKFAWLRPRLTPSRR